MTNTTTPAELIGAPSGVASFYRWEVPDKSISILLSLDLIDRLERDVIDSFKAVTKRGSEIGGVLGGRVIAGSRPTVIVERFEAVECDYSRGPLYLLSDEDKTKLREALDRVGKGSVAGFFRSNTRRELVLDEEDQALAHEFFPDPNHVFLLVRPFAMKPSAGGFFFWENGQIHGDATYLQFPFKRAELLKSFAEFIVAAPEPAVEAPPVREPLVMPRREERPVAPPMLKREEPLPPAPPPAALRREEPKREEPVAPPPILKREEPKPPVIVPPRREESPQVTFRREERQPAARREEPPQAPKPEPRSPVLGPRREERVAPPVILKREERPPIAPVAPRREERPPAPVLRREEPAPPAPVLRREEPAPPAPLVTAKKEEKPPAPAITPRREERPAVVARREEKPAPAPVVVKPEEPAPVKPEEKPVVAKAPEVVVVAPAKREEPAKVEPAKVEPPKVEPPKPATAAPAAVAESIERLPVRPAEAAAPGLFSRLKWVIVALALVVVAGGGYYFFVHRPGAGTVATKAADTSLGLKVETNAGQLLLSWNRTAPLIATATRATLSIMDGDHKEDVDLDLGSLRSGSIVYSPMTNDVSFRLEVTDLKNGKSQAETVRRLAGRPSPSVAATNLPQQQPVMAKPAANIPDKPAAEPVRTSPATTAASAPSTPQVVAGPAVTAAPPRPDTLAARLRAPEPQEIPAPPSLDTQSNALTSRAPVSSLGSVPPPPTPQTTRTTPPAPQTTRNIPPAPSQASPVRVGGQTQEARVIKRFPATYPSLARQVRLTGIVRVQATVGKNGRIKKATAVSGPQMLRQAAADAVLKWIYSPAILDGEPVESETQVDVTFSM